MFFWFKRKKVVLECFTANEIAFDYAKIDKLIKFYPDWWKKTKKFELDNIPTIKNCVGFIDFYKRAITIPLWSRIRFIFREDGSYEWKTSNDVIFENHDRTQFKGFALNDGINMKIVTPWTFRTKTLKYFLWSSPLYNHRNLINYMTLMPGMIEFKYNRDTNINFIISNIKNEKTIEIEPFTPMVAIHPMFEDDIEIKNFLLDENELKKISYSKFFYFNLEISSAYKNKKKIIDHVESKCPYHKE